MMADQFLECFSPLASRENEPAVLSRFRQEAWKKLQHLGMPDSKNDQFQYLKLHQLYASPYTIAEPFNITPKPLEETKNSFIVFVNGILRLDLSSLSGLGNGCVVKSFADASKTYATLLSNSFTKSVKEERDHFALLNMACFQDGIFLYIPPKTVVSAPIEIMHLMSSKACRACLPRILVCMGAHAEAKIALTATVDGAENLLASSLFEARLEDGAHLHVIETFLEEGSGFVFSATRSSLKQSALLKQVQLAHGKIPIRFDTRVCLNGEGSEALLSGMWITASHEECHTNVLVEHYAPNTHSDQLFKGVLFDQSRSSFQGKIYIHREAQKTLAYQLNNNLLFSDEA